jgi:putative peptidoglycan lipid II flippase
VHGSTPDIGEAVANIEPDPPGQVVVADGPPAPRARRRSWKRQTLISSVLVLVTAVLGIWTQAVLAAALGLSGAADAYFSALVLCTFVTYILTQTVINRWVPQLASSLDTYDAPTDAFWAAGWRLARWVALPGLALGVVLFVGAPLAVRLVAPGLDDNTHALAAQSLRIMSLPLGLQLAGTGAIAIQYALQGQPIIQASGLLYSASVIPAVLLLTPALGATSAAIGAALSFVLMFAVVLGATLVTAREPRSPLPPSSTSVRGRSVAVITLASIVVYGQTVLGPIIASTLAAGTVAQLSFAWRPAEVLSRALPTVIAYSVMPALAAAHARGNRVQLEHSISEVLQLSLGLMLPIAALMVGVREPLVTLLYQRAAFSTDAVQAVAPTLGWFAAGLPAYSVVLVLSTIFISIGRERWALATGTAVVAAYALLGFGLGQLYGGAGVAQGFCLACVGVALGGTAATGRRDPRGLLMAAWFRWSALGAVLALAGAAAGIALMQGRPTWVQLLAGAIMGGIGAGIGVVGAEGAFVRSLLARLRRPALAR